ncbi:carboxymuconolactone decarboxylase family protein [Streptomyces sp. NPDC050418]|uniref:carboxymuconolactone decarboxylase family protein n=1 Tax=Streptomyces sp. NPDC050418 TaxID=3365612 RepID=UPI00378A831C
MTARLDLFGNEHGAKFLKHLVSAGKIISDSPLSTAFQELIALRVSQINGCAMCVDIHTKHLAHEGEDAVRIQLVAAWREATVYTEPERAALELAEQATRVADAAGGVPDEVWDAASKHFTEDELVALVSLIALMNAMNRLNVAVRNPAGSYVIGQF